MDVTVLNKASFTINGDDEIKNCKTFSTIQEYGSFYLITYCSDAYRYRDSYFHYYQLYCDILLSHSTSDSYI